jgi:uncharacterized protein with HEPN domain
MSSATFSDAWIKLGSNPTVEHPSFDTVASKKSVGKRIEHISSALFSPQTTPIPNFTEVLKSAYQYDVSQHTFALLEKFSPGLIAIMTATPRGTCEAHHAKALTAAGPQEMFAHLFLMHTLEVTDLTKCNQIAGIIFDLVADPNSPHHGLLCCLAMFSLNEENPTAAHKTCSEALKKQGSDYIPQLKGYTLYNGGEVQAMLQQFELIQKKDPHHLFCLAIAYLVNRKFKQGMDTLKHLVHDPVYRNLALQIVLTYYRDKSQFKEIEALLENNRERETELNEDSRLLFLDLRMHLLLRKGSYEQAAELLVQYREFPKGTSLLMAREAQLILRTHQPGQSIAKAFTALNSALNIPAAKTLPWFLHYEIAIVKIEYAWLVGRYHEAYQIDKQYSLITACTERSFVANCLEVILCCGQEEKKQLLQIYLKHYCPSANPDLLVQVLHLYSLQEKVDTGKVAATVNELLREDLIGKYRCAAMYFLWLVNPICEPHLIKELLNLSETYYLKFFLTACAESNKKSVGLNTYKEWLKKFPSKPYAFIEFAKHARLANLTQDAVIVLEDLSKDLDLRLDARRDLFHALAYLYFVLDACNQFDEAVKQAEPEVYAPVNGVLGHRYHTQFKNKEAVRAFEKAFFFSWQMANPSAFYSDTHCDIFEKHYAKLYFEALVIIYRKDLPRVLEHINQFLDSMPFNTVWKHNFAVILQKSAEDFEKENLGGAFKVEKGKVAKKYLDPFEKMHQGLNHKLIHLELKQLLIKEGAKFSRDVVEAYVKEHQIGPVDSDWEAHFKNAMRLSEPKEILREILLMGPEKRYLGGDQFCKPFKKALGYLDRQLSETTRDPEIATILCLISDNKYHDLLTGTNRMYSLLLNGIAYCIGEQPDQMLKFFSDFPGSHYLIDLGLAVAYFLKDDFDQAAVFLRKLIHVKHLSDQALLYLLIGYKDRGDMLECERIISEEQSRDVTRNRECQLLIKDLKIQIEFFKGNDSKAVEMVSAVLKEDPENPFFLARRALLGVANHLKGCSIVEEDRLMKQAERFYQPENYPPCLRDEFEMMRVNYCIYLEDFQRAMNIAKEFQKFSSEPIKVLIPEMMLLSGFLNDPEMKGPDRSAVLAKARQFLVDKYLENAVLPEYLVQACNLLQHINSKQNSQQIIKLATKGLKLNANRRHRPLLFMHLWQSYVATADSRATYALTELKKSLLESPRHYDCLTRFIKLHHQLFPSLELPLDIVKAWLERYGLIVPKAFLSITEFLWDMSLSSKCLELLRFFEEKFPSNPDLLQAFAELHFCLRNYTTAREYIQKSINADPKHIGNQELLARVNFHEDGSNADEAFEGYYRLEMGQMKLEAFWRLPMVFTNKDANRVISYVKFLNEKYHHDQQAVSEHIQRFLSQFDQPRDLLSNLKSTLEAKRMEYLKQLKKAKKAKKPQKHDDDAEGLERGRQEFKKQQEDLSRRLQQEQERLAKIQEEEQKKRLESNAIKPIVVKLEPDQDERDNQMFHKARRAAEKEELRRMLDLSTVVIPRRGRLTEKEAILMAEELAKESRQHASAEPVIVPQQKVRERYIPIEPKEVVVPMATTVLTQAKPAAVVKVQQVFALIPDAEKDRLNQAFSSLQIIAGLLKRLDKPEYHPDLQEFIMQRALMYQLLRLGEALFPQSASVRRTLSPIYQPTMEKLISSAMIPVIRNQLRHEYMNVTLSKVAHACRCLVESTLSQNLELWNDFNRRPHNTSALLKTVLPESCFVADPAMKVIPLVFLGSELRKLGSLLDKISHDVLAMNPDIVFAVKMSVCILCEMAKLEEFKGKIKGLERFILAGNKIAHEFGEDCEFYSSDEISLFDIRPYVVLAREVHEANFPKSTGVLSAKAPAFVMCKKP